MAKQKPHKPPSNQNLGNIQGGLVSTFKNPPAPKKKKPKRHKSGSNTESQLGKVEGFN